MSFPNLPPPIPESVCNPFSRRHSYRIQHAKVHTILAAALPPYNEQLLSLRAFATVATPPLL
jgi:hypothetical protein